MFFGANLQALRKKNGCLRPIAVGLTLRRLISKVASRWGSAWMSPLLAPRQLGVGVSGGAEAMVHATSTFLLSSSPWQAVVKLDFIDAFNTVRRDSMLETVAQDLPEFFNYVSS